MHQIQGVQNKVQELMNISEGIMAIGEEIILI